jgi:hypothetical protein
VRRKSNAILLGTSQQGVLIMDWLEDGRASRHRKLAACRGLTVG